MKTVRRGQVLIKEGQPPLKKFSIIYSGEFTVDKKDTNKDKLIFESTFNLNKTEVDK